MEQKTISLRIKAKDFKAWKKHIEADGKTISGALRLLILKDKARYESNKTVSQLVN